MIQLAALLFEAEIPKNAWELIISSADKEELSDELIDNVKTAYSTTTEGSFVNSLRDVLASDWKVIDWDEDPEVDATIFWRGPRANEPWKGKKIQGIGHDGQQNSKKVVIAKVVELLNQPEWWLEASDAMRKVMLKNGVPVITDAEIIQKIFPSTPVEMIDEKTYTRELPGGHVITETLFGHPVVT